MEPPPNITASIVGEGGGDGEIPIKKKPKKKKLSKKERAARRKAEEIAFKKAEIQLRFQKELELSKKSVQRGEKDWENMCKEIKNAELKEELREWNKKTQRLFEQKDERIEFMLQNISETDEIHTRNYSKQIELMDYLIESYKTLLDSSKATYQFDASELIQDFLTELNEKEMCTAELKRAYENAMHTINFIVEQQLFEDNEIFTMKRNDRVDTQIERRYRIRDRIVDKMRALHDQLLQFIESLKGASLDMHKHVRIKQLIDRQRNFIIESQKLNDIEFRSNRTLNDMQRDQTQKDLESQQRINDLRLEIAYFLQVHKNIEHEIQQAKDITHQQLRILSSECYKVTTMYKKLEKFGELLLSLSANCRKMETQSEKVMPRQIYGDEQKTVDESESDDDEKFKIKAMDIMEHLDLTEDEIISQFKLMKHFWRRQGNVEMHNLVLIEEKRKLKQENQKYIDFIKSLSRTVVDTELQGAINIECVLPPSSAPPACSNQK